jgi:glycosyltransferase involved in cell wall biosynthesis
MDRVAIVTTSYPRSESDAAGHFVQTEARALAAAGQAVTVFAPGQGPTPGGDGTPGTGPRRGVESSLSVRFLGGADAFGFPGALARLRERPARLVTAAEFVHRSRRALVAEGPFDRVIAHWLVPSAWPIAIATRSPLEVVVHGSDARLVERLPGALRLRLIESLLDRGATFRFVSEELRDRLARATTPRLIAAATSTVEPCAIDVSSAPSRADARRALSIATSERVAVVVGRLVPSKNPAQAIALAGAHADRVVVVGEGPLAPSIRAAFPGATFTGQLDRPTALAWIAAADLLVSASRDEGAPTVIREARALGTRVLAFPAGDLRDWAARDPGIELV